MSAQQIRSVYASMPERLAQARKKLGHPLTLAEKILVAHCWNFGAQAWERGKAILRLRVDRVGLQDVTGQMALLQFLHSGRKRVAVPSTLHCDHLIRAESGSADDLARAIKENEEVYDFPHWDQSNYDVTDVYNLVIRQLAEANDLILADVYAAEVGVDRIIDADHVHPNDLGHRLIANRVFEAIARNCSFVARTMPAESIQAEFVRQYGMGPDRPGPRSRALLAAGQRPPFHGEVWK